MKKYHVPKYQLFRVDLTVEANTPEEANEKATAAVTAGCYEDGLPTPRPVFQQNLHSDHVCEVA